MTDQIKEKNKASLPFILFNLFIVSLAGFLMFKAYSLHPGSHQTQYEKKECLINLEIIRNRIMLYQQLAEAGMAEQIDLGGSWVMAVMNTSMQKHPSRMELPKCPTTGIAGSYLLSRKGSGALFVSCAHHGMAQEIIQKKTPQRSLQVKNDPPPEDDGLQGISEKDRQALITGAETDHWLKSRLEYLRSKKVEKGLRSSFAQGWIERGMDREQLKILLGDPEKIEQKGNEEILHYNLIGFHKGFAFIDGTLSKMYEIEKGIVKTRKDGFSGSLHDLRDYYPENLSRTKQLQSSIGKIKYDATIRFFCWSPDGSKAACFRNVSTSRLVKADWRSSSSSSVSSSTRLHIIDVNTGKVLRDFTLIDSAKNFFFGLNPSHMAWGGDRIFMDGYARTGKDFQVTLYSFDPETFSREAVYQWNTSDRWTWDMDKTGKKLVYVSENPDQISTMYLRTADGVKSLLNNRSSGLNYTGFQMLGWSTSFTGLIFFSEYSSNAISKFIDPESLTIYEAKSFCAERKKDHFLRIFSPVSQHQYLECRYDLEQTSSRLSQDVYQSSRSDLVLYHAKTGMIRNLTGSIP